MAADDKNWYVLRVVSGKENKIKEYLEMEIGRSNWGDIVTQILVPKEKVYKLRGGKKVIQEKNFYPGYMLVEAVASRFSGEIIAMVNQTTNVIHFLGKDNPIPIKQNEVNRILGKVDEMQEVGVTVNEPFLLGETVKIIDGPFNDFNGTIEEVDEDKQRLKVIVKIFGRRTPVELKFMEVEKV